MAVAVIFLLYSRCLANAEVSKTTWEAYGATAFYDHVDEASLMQQLRLHGTQLLLVSHFYLMKNDVITRSYLFQVDSLGRGEDESIRFACVVAKSNKKDVDVFLRGGGLITTVPELRVTSQAQYVYNRMIHREGIHKMDIQKALGLASVFIKMIDMDAELVTQDVPAVSPNVAQEGAQREPVPIVGVTDSGRWRIEVFQKSGVGTGLWSLLLDKEGYVESFSFSENENSSSK